MQLKKAVLGLMLAGALGACSDTPTSPTDTQLQFARPANTTTIVESVTGVIAGGSFTGTATITDFAIENGELVVSGVLSGVATVGGVATQITGQTFTQGAALTTTFGKCDILFLDVGPIFLDVLGLQVDLSQIVLDIAAQSGAGNLLGNLLCAVTHLLDNPFANIAAILNLLDKINDLLG
jgi:hypothetical protein